MNQKKLGFKENVNYRELRAQERRREILEVSTRLFSTKGYAAVTIEEIATNINMTKGSLYHYVESKEDLLYECYRAAMDPLLESTQEIINTKLDPEEKLKRIIKNHIEQLLSAKHSALVILQQLDSIPKVMREMMKTERRQYESLFYQVIKENIKAKELKPKNITLVTYFILGAINSIPTWYKETGKIPSDKICEFFVSNLLFGIKNGMK